MIIKNATICDKDFKLIKADLEFKNGVITQIGKTQGEGEDYSGKVVLPGFIDIHIHGCNRADCSDGVEGEIQVMSEFLATKGVTSFCPATMTVSTERIKKAFSAIKNTMGKEKGAKILGINMEGPFISEEKKGAQASENILKPNVEFFEEMNALCPVRLVSIAPETEGAENFVNKVKDKCTVSAAHTMADYEKAVNAFGWGISHCTHLFNAMTPFTSRAPGLVGAVFDSETVTAELICDLIHIHPAVLRTAFKVLGKNRTVVISDAMMAAGLEDGVYSLGGQKVIKKGAARLEDGTLAGSASNLFEEFKNLISIGVDFEQIIRSLTINPARVVGEDKSIGSIEIGKKADFLITNESFTEIEAVFIDGCIVK